MKNQWTEFLGRDRKFHFVVADLEHPFITTWALARCGQRGAVTVIAPKGVPAREQCPNCAAHV